MLQINKVHQVLTSKFALKFLRGGIAKRSLPLPYIQYDLTMEKKYSNYQILKQRIETSLIVNTEYKNPTYSIYQYSLIHDGNDFEAISKFGEVYNYMTTGIFKLAINTEKIHHTMMSPITEINLDKQEFFERRFLFDVRYAWADISVVDETDIGLIESVIPNPPVRVPAIAGL